jgi:hypothetical protein
MRMEEALIIAGDVVCLLPVEVVGWVDIGGEPGALIRWSNGILQARMESGEWRDLDQGDAYLHLDQSRRAAGRTQTVSEAGKAARRKNLEKARSKRWPGSGGTNDPRR